MEFHDDFKRPHAPHSPHGIRPQDFPIYAGGPPYLLPPGSSAFHRPLDPSGKPIPVSMVNINNPPSDGKLILITFLHPKPDPNEPRFPTFATAVRILHQGLFES